MSISVQIYSNANSSSRSVTFDFVGDILAPTDAPANAACNAFYFKVTTSGKQDSGSAFPLKIVRGLDELVLNGNNQRVDGSANAYSDIRSMVIDYVYDYIHGHGANLYGSGCTAQSPMEF